MSKQKVCVTSDSLQTKASGKNKMEKEYTLKKFVQLCNKCSYDKYISCGDDAAVKLAKNIVTLNGSSKYKKCCIREDNKAFYDYLRENNVEGRYAFRQDNSIVPEINVFEPFADSNGKEVLNQKWHTLISFLAYLDFLNYEKRANDCIEKIIVWKNRNGYKRVSVIFACRRRKTYRSAGMCDWIFNAVGESE